MILAILFYLFIFLSMINLLHIGFYLVGANLYDIWQLFRVRRLRQTRLRPLVSVLIPAHNEAKSIIRCLESVRKNSYRKLEIIVIDDASTDATRQLVRSYIKRYHYRNIHLLWRRHNAGKAGALNHALRYAVHGELVMSLDADSVLRKDAIKNVVSYFQDPTIAGVAANVRIMDSFSILGLLQKFEHMIGYRSKKFYSMSKSEFIVGGVASTYRFDVLKQVKFYDQDTVTEDIGLSLKVTALGNKLHRIVYAADVIASTEAVQSFPALLRQRYRWKMGSLQNLLRNRELVGKVSKNHSLVLTWYRLPMAFFSELMLLLEPIILTYVLYLSIHFDSPSLIVGAYGVITGYVLWNVWPDEHMSWRQKLKMTAMAPFMYFIFYIMNVVQIVAIVRCLYNYKQVLRRVNVISYWVSPERSGKQIQFS